MPTHKDTCFVIMPFSKTATHTKAYWTRHFQGFLKPLIDENPLLEAKRSRALRGDILTQIITDLATARVVVADITDHNCNVFWELGVRQSFKHGTVTIAEINTPLPFDTAGTGTLFYDTRDHLQIQQFRDDFKRAIEDCLSNPNRPDSHVLESLSGRGTLFEVFRRDEAIRRLHAIEASCDTNATIWRRIVERARANQENPEERRYIADRLRTAPLELLTTNRYLEEDESFYAEADAVLGHFAAANATLAVWVQTPHAIEKWILGNEHKYQNRFKEFKKTVRTIRVTQESWP
jgi:hypothetical protein